ncbi:hypothetical protein BC829DRAFT_440357 [Chytridium lagenaria]|nr:hypothetical protein BC829DRAFT_440357 [Chytridium lagenaria]
MSEQVMSSEKAIDAMTKAELLDELRKLSVPGVNNKSKKNDLVALLMQVREKQESTEEADVPVSVESLNKVEEIVELHEPVKEELSDESMELQVEVSPSPNDGVLTEEEATHDESDEVKTVEIAVSERPSSSETLAVSGSESEEIQAWLEVEGFESLKKIFADEELKEWAIVRELKFDHLRAMGVTVGTCLKVLKRLREKFEVVENNPYKLDEMRSALEDLLVTSLKSKSESGLPKLHRKEPKTLPPPSVKATPHPHPIVKSTSHIPPVVKATPAKTLPASKNSEADPAMPAALSTVKTLPFKARPSLVPSMLTRTAHTSATVKTNAPKKENAAPKAEKPMPSRPKRPNPLLSVV